MISHTIVLTTEELLTLSLAVHDALQRALSQNYKNLVRIEAVLKNAYDLYIEAKTAETITGEES